MPVPLTIALILVLGAMLWVLLDIRRSLRLKHGITAEDLLNLVTELRSAHEHLAAAVDRLRQAQEVMAAVVDHLRIAQEKLAEMGVSLMDARMTALGVEVTALRENVDQVMTAIKPILAVVR